MIREQQSTVQVIIKYFQQIRLFCIQRKDYLNNSQDYEKIKEIKSFVGILFCFLNMMTHYGGIGLSEIYLYLNVGL